MESQMKQTLLLLILLISKPCFAGEYSDCILENMKGVSNGFAANQVKNACEEKALRYVPAKCFTTDEQRATLRATFALLHLTPSFDEYIINSACVNECLNASYWSKHFGDCKE